ncbi:hypothetical protein [Pantanalinema rosaneae]|uniref:hypothetical protein n=1 Tax=Pantanalinema rosaneae TaxID=1620701 RepID=UPI003D6EFE3D
MAFKPPARSRPLSPRRRPGLLEQSSQPVSAPRQPPGLSRQASSRQRSQAEPATRPPGRRTPRNRPAIGSPTAQPKRFLTHSSPPAAPSRVRRLPAHQQLPTSVRLLIQIQRGSVAVAFVLVTAALIVYGSTVYMQQLWSKEYRQLKTLERNERQMVAASDVMKEQIVQQAERPGSGLVRRTKDMAIFLEPAPARPAKSPVTPSAPKADATATHSPLGY